MPSEEVDWSAVDRFANRLPQGGEEMEPDEWKKLYDEASLLEEPTSLFVDEMLILYKPEQLVLAE